MRNLNIQNKSLVMKWLWKFASPEESSMEGGDCKMDDRGSHTIAVYGDPSGTYGNKSPADQVAK